MNTHRDAEEEVGIVRLGEGDVFELGGHREALEVRQQESSAGGFDGAGDVAERPNPLAATRDPHSPALLATGRPDQHSALGHLPAKMIE